MQIDKKADFVLKGNKVLSPPVRTDGLELYYDTKGKKNTDTHKDKLLDMSGNGRHGELHNFSYKKLSGYQEDSELVFDGVDDTLKVPKLNGIDANNFTYQLNNNILAVNGDEVKTVKNGNVVEVVERNYLLNSDFSSEGEFWDGHFSISGEGAILESVVGSSHYIQNTTIVPEGDYIFQVWYEVLEGDPPYLFNNGGSDSTWGGGYTLIDPNEGYSYVGITIRSDSRMPAIRYASGSPVGHLEGRTLIKRVKLEKGNTVTDWTPAPEDLIETTELKGNILGDMEDIIDDHTRDEQSGLKVFTDKADDSLVRVGVDGKSYQHAGSGKNLASSEAFLLGNAFYGNTATVRFMYSQSPETMAGIFSVKPNTKYVFSYSQEYETRRVSLFTTNEAIGEVASRDWANQAGRVSFTTDNEITVAIAIQRKDKNPVSEEDSINAHFQLEEGSVATEYEPPAPTPDYPIEIHSLNDFDMVSSVGKRNLIRNGDFKDGISNWWGSSGEVANRDGYTYYEFIGNGAANMHGTGANSKVLLEPNTEYIYSVDMWAEEEIKISRSTPLHYHIRSISTGKGAAEGGVGLVSDSRIEANKWSRVILQFSTNSTTDGYLQPYIYAFPNGVLGRVKNFKLEKGSTVTPWVPAPEDITENDNHPLIDKINLSLSEPLRSVGDVKDRLFRDSDGLWKVERNIKEISYGKNRLTTKTSSYGAMAEAGLVIYWDEVLDRPYRSLYTSTHYRFNGLINWNINTEANTLSENSTRTQPLVGFNVSASEFPSRESFNNWLIDRETEGQPVKVLHQTMEPTIEILDEDLQDKLNNLRSFQDSNYVHPVINNRTDISLAISENLKPTIHTKFLAKDHYKENRTINNLLIWNRSLEDEELLSQNKLFHGRFNMRSNTIKGEPINQEINLTQGGYAANTLSLDYTLEI